MEITALIVKAISRYHCRELVMRMQNSLMCLWGNQAGFMMLGCFVTMQYMFHDIPHLATDGNCSVTVHMYAGTSRLFSAYVRRDFPFVQCICTQGLPVCSVHMYAGTSRLF